MICIESQVCVESSVISETGISCGQQAAPLKRRRCLHGSQLSGDVIAAVHGATAIVVLSLLLLPTAARATTSDLLIALKADGRSFLAQHTVASNGPLLSVNLPDGATVLETRFMGPENLTFAHAGTQNPDRLALWSGSAFARYHHHYGDAVEQNTEGEFQLTSSSIPANVVVDEGSLTQSSITWLFPDSLEVVSYSTTESATGVWQASINTLTFSQTDGQPVTLGIIYRHRKTSDENPADPCKAGSTTTDACSPDIDTDGVPDHRDICLDSRNVNPGVLGCDDDQSVILHDIVFASGQSYLDVNARRVLDRVALALQQDTVELFEVGAHTDNGGGASRNRKLSQQRADAVRYYLMLRGVGPNQVYAAGYGETYPLQDNSHAAGRRANRRVELTRVQ